MAESEANLNMADETRKIRATRRSARGWVTRATASADDALQDPRADRISLELALKELNKRVDKFEEAQAEYESLVSDEEFQGVLEEASEFLDNVRKVQAQLIVRIDKFSEPQELDRQSNHSSNVVQLPKLELKKFDGVITEWPAFWDSYKTAVDDAELSPVSKFNYLRSLLEGEAVRAIEGLTLTGHNYAIALDILKERYGREELITFSHIQGLLALSANSEGKGSGLSKLRYIQEQVLIHVRSLASHGVDERSLGIFLTPLILAALPNEVRMEWARHGKGRERDLSFLLEFVKEEIHRRERANSFKVKEHGQPKSSESKRNHKEVKGGSKRAATAAALVSQRESPCPHCKGDHPTYKCASLWQMQVKDRNDIIKSLGLCFKCLKQSHKVKDCDYTPKCRLCGKGHQSMLCGFNAKGSKKGPTMSPPETGVTEASSTVNVAQGKIIKSGAMYQIAQVIALGKGTQCRANILFDSGSDQTYISTKLAKRLRLCPVSSVKHRYSVFGGEKSSVAHKNVYELRCKSTSSREVTVSGIEVDQICSPLRLPPIPPQLFKKLEAVNLACPMQCKSPVDIDILIGLDHYWELVTNEIIRLPNNMVAQGTLFGYILSGQMTAKSFKSPGQTLSSHLMFCLNDLSNSEVRQFWELDSIGIRDKPEDPSVGDPVLEEFSKAICFTGERYRVSLPWKQGRRPWVVNNVHLAKQRLHRLQIKLKSNPSLHKAYTKYFDDLLKQGIIERVDPSKESPFPIYYLPHRPVVRDDSVSTKVRPVFDASARGINGVSLNDCLEVGPPLIPNIVDILVRFRRWKVALVADITKAFLQIELSDQDKEVHRFLLEQEGQIRHFKFNRVTFGVNASPFLLNATIKYHLSQQPDSRAVQELQTNLYVDDWLSGADNEAEASTLYRDASTTMVKAGMQLSKWNSNSLSLLEKFVADERNNPLQNQSVKVLGFSWNLERDSFEFTGIQIPNGIILTKRTILSLLARIFDPVGFLAPYIMLAKCLFQKLWQLGLQWDDEVPQEYHADFYKWLEGLSTIPQWKIPRRFSADSLWSQLDHIELHAFGDASGVAYGAVVYLRIQHSDNEFSSNLVMSKGKVAPLKKLTLPRLELLGALLAARLLIHVQGALQFPGKVHHYLYTDSTATLGWIKGDPNRWKQFVANRVREIQNCTNPEDWFHCPGVQNPADIVSRGMMAEALVSSDMWLHGPAWLSEPVDNPCQRTPLCDQPMEESLGLLTKSDPPKGCFPLDRWSTLGKALRVVQHVMKFIAAMKLKTGLTTELTHAQSDECLLVILKQVQNESYWQEIDLLTKGKSIPKESSLNSLSPFLDSKGIIRIRGRLESSALSYAEKHPVVIPNGQLARLLAVQTHVQLKHAGVTAMLTELRNRYWIIGLRRIAKSVVKSCVSCRKVMSTSPCAEAAPLPETRVTAAPPFFVSGVDYAGPLFTDVPNTKVYICLFTCAVTRAVHIELAESLSSNDFVTVFRRFAARRGIPHIVYSDNGKNFKGAQAQLEALYAHLAPKWKFIVPHAPWWGGWWERLIRSVKSALKKSLGKLVLNKSQLVTMLCEIEFCINSRPLTYVSDDAETDSPITPNHFLLANHHYFCDAPNEMAYDPQTLNQILCDSLGNKVELLNSYWNIWSKEYIRGLTPVVPQFKEKGRGLKVDDVVIIQEDFTPRLQWPLGRIIEVLEGRDGVVRSCKVKTGKHVVTRPIQKLHFLEVNGGSPLEVQIEPSVTIEHPPLEEVYIKSRVGRTIRPPKRLDL